MEINRQTIEFIHRNASADVKTLALKADKYPEVDMKMALIQIEGRQKARQKLPLWASTDGIIYPLHISLEQCSSEVTAAYKAHLVTRLLSERENMVDLTGGFGIDCYFIGREFSQVTYVERQSQLCEIATNNFHLLGLDGANIVCGDSVSYLRSMSRVDLIFIDPARRNENGGRTIAISDCMPDVTQLEELMLTKSRCVMVKLSPMLDWHQVVRELHHVSEIHIVSVGNECREMIAVLTDEAREEVKVYCVNDAISFEFSSTKENVGPVLADSAAFREDDPIQRYLYEPNSSIMKAGCFGLLTEKYDVCALDYNSHLFVADHFIEDFPGRIFVIDKFFSLNKRDVRSCLSDVSHANISVRNFPLTVAELRKRLKLKEGGDCYLFATTLADGRRVIIRGHKPMTLC
jgi:hypothetical protein